MSGLQLVLTWGYVLVSTAGACWVPTDLTPQEIHQAEALKHLYAKDDLACNKKEATWQAQRFVASLKKSRHSSACAAHWWMRQLATHKLNGSRRAAIADIGCNKAYFSGAALNYLATGYGDHLQELFKHHDKRSVYGRPCGHCSECKQGPDSRPIEGQTQVDVLCVEPSEVHIKSLTIARDAIYGPPGVTGTAAAAQRTQVSFHVVQAAVSNKTGVAHFPRNCAQNTCSIGDEPTDFFAVNMTTVDTTMGPTAAGSPWPFFDLMKVDTEGFDPAVLAGAYRSLLAHRIGMLSFEYHHLWMRTGGTLKTCTAYLRDLGFACFYDAPVLAKVSGDCWDDRYELHKWTNIVCALRGSPMEAELMAGSYLAGKLGGGKSYPGAP